MGLGVASRSRLSMQSPRRRLLRQHPYQPLLTRITLCLTILRRLPLPLDPEGMGLTCGVDRAERVAGRISTVGILISRLLTQPGVDNGIPT